MPTSTLPSRDYFDARFQDLARHFTTSVGTIGQRVDVLGQQTKDGFQKIDHTLTEVNAKLDALMEMVAVRQELRNLVRELRAKGVEIDDTKIYVA